MKNRVLISSLIPALFCAVATTAQAQPNGAKEQYAQSSKNAASRYAEDKKLCAEESNSRARMQCLRDARTEYDTALAAAKAAAGTPQTNNKLNNPTLDACSDCARVISVKFSEKEGEGGALGVIAGGVAGAVLGHQVGSGRGKDLATIAGAAGGAYAGRKIEQKANTSKVWTVAVEYGNGEKRSFHFDHDPAFQAGDIVKNSGNSIVRH